MNTAIAIIGALLASWGAALAQPAPSVRIAEVIEASGTVELRREPATAWSPARPGQSLIASDALRTHALSFAKLKFEAGLQWQLAAASELQLQNLGSGSTTSIQIRLERGGAVARWNPDRAAAAAAAPRATIQTASGEAVILGTEWSIRADEDGRTTVVVVEGAVELSNAHGAVTVRANEAGEMRVGVAPALLQVVNARDRVQWVVDYEARPARFLGPSSDDRRNEASALLASADTLIASGDFARARAEAEAGRARYPTDGRFAAMLSTLALIEDRPADSKALADAAIELDAAAIDGWVALGEWAMHEGDGRVAERAWRRATTLDDRDARGWFGLGWWATEREDFPTARRALARALSLEPGAGRYHGEFAMLHALANQLGAATREYSQALSARSNDYVALTGQALVALKQGDERTALDLLLRATLIEPRYARAHMYLGVAYYRMRRHDDALRALAKASDLDPRDPLPHVMQAVIHGDLYQPAKAMAAARTARDLMPNLKSLHQLADTQKGTANLGSSVAFFGMEAWAQHLAHESYVPFWSGSHLFLGDRYAGTFARTSEYYQGLLLDPTVLGGSPLFQTLVPRAGHYLGAAASVSHDALSPRHAGGSLSLNGYANRGMPVGYAVTLDAGHGSSAPPAESGRRTPARGSLAFGAALNPQWNVFANGAVVQQHERFSVDLFNAHDTYWTQRARRLDGGLAFRPSPSAAFMARAAHTTMAAAFPLGDFLRTLSLRARPVDLQTRWTQIVGARHEVSAGAEWSSDTQILDVAFLDFPSLRHRRELSSAQAFVSTRWRWGRTLVQGDLFTAHERVRLPAEAGEEAIPEHRATTLQPRLGAAVRIGPSLVRVAFQQRTRPWAASSTLGPVATAGVAVDDQFVEHGGDQRRMLVQMEWEATPQLYVLAVAEHQTIHNRWPQNWLENALVDVERAVRDHSDGQGRDVSNALSDLRSVFRDASHSNVDAIGLLEADPNVADGRVSSYGVTINRVVGTQLSVAARYRFTPSSGVTMLVFEPDDESRGQALSFVPRHTTTIGGTWVSPRRLYVSAQAVHRTARFDNDHNRREWTGTSFRRAMRASEWTARVAGSWESRDKRWAIEASGTEMFGDYEHATYLVTVKVRR